MTPAGRQELAEAARGWLLLTPAILAVGIFLALALITTLVTSFWSQDYLTIVRDFTLTNYAQTLSEPLFRVLFLRSLWIAGITTLLCVLIAYPIAYYIVFYVRQRKVVWIVLLTIPFWTSYLLRVFAWKLVLGFNGIINSGLKSLGMIDQPLTFLLYNPLAIVITLVHAWLPFAVLPIYVNLEKMDRSLLEAATDLGDSPLERFFRITLPLSMPGVLAATMMIFIPTVGDYVTPLMVGGPDGLMIANAIGAQFGKSNNWPLGSALSLTSMVLVSVVALAVMTLGRRTSGSAA
ncbi:MAG: ABC transporter permease [Geminicoccaceae bacterium]